MELGALATAAQQFLSARPVVILGTGATIPHGLPSMDSLADALLQAIPAADAGKWSAFVEHLSETKDLEASLHELTLDDAMVEFLVAETWAVVTSGDLRFHRQLSSGPVSFPLRDLLRHLLRTADSRLNVVTTNYDRVAEYAANRAGAYVSTGMTDGWIQRFEQSLAEGA